MKIIQDTKEKMPWNLSFYGIQQELGSLKTGDYCIEDLLVIERKRNTGELSINLGSKSKQFYSELQRMAEFPHKYIICEFSLNDIDIFPINSGIPKNKWKFIRMNGNFIMSRLTSWCEEFDISPVFAGSRKSAENTASDIIKEIYAKETI